MLTKSVESFSKSFFQNALELYFKMWQLGKLQSVMDSYYDKSCDICAQTVTLPAYELFRARSTRIRRFLNPQCFLCVFGLRPHVSSVSGIRIRIFFNPLFRVEIFEYAMPIQNHMDAKSGYFFFIHWRYMIEPSSALWIFKTVPSAMFSLLYFFDFRFKSYNVFAVKSMITVHFNRANMGVDMKWNWLFPKWKSRNARRLAL